MENGGDIKIIDTLEVVKKKMERLLQQGRNDEKLNDKYRQLIKK